MFSRREQQVPSADIYILLWRSNLLSGIGIGLGIPGHDNAKWRRWRWSPRGTNLLFPCRPTRVVISSTLVKRIVDFYAFPLTAFSIFHAADQRATVPFSQFPISHLTSTIFQSKGCVFPFPFIFGIFSSHFPAARAFFGQSVGQSSTLWRCLLWQRQMDNGERIKEKG